MSRMLPIILCVIASSGCARLTPGGKRVRIAHNLHEVSSCQSAGNVSGTGSGAAWGKREAMTRARNEAATRNADTIVVTLQSQEPLASEVEAMAFRCGVQVSRAPAQPARVARRPSTASTVKFALLATDFEKTAEQLVPGKVFDDAVATAITDAGHFEVVGQRDIEAMIDFEKQKDLLGCDEVTCFVEIGGALGVPYMAKFSVARVNDEWVITSKAIDVRENRVVRRSTRFVAGDTNALIKDVPGMVADLLHRDTDGTPRGPKVVKPLVVPTRPSDRAEPEMAEVEDSGEVPAIPDTAREPIRPSSEKPTSSLRP